MGQVKEDFEVVVRELGKKSEVKDISFSLNTSQSGTARFITQPINGILEAVIIKCDSPFEVSIMLDGKNVSVFEITNINGINYLPIRTSAIWKDGENFKDSPEKWVLNDSLNIVVAGGLNKDIWFIVRYI